MATKLNIVAQYAEDSFLQTYRVTTDFFIIEDWIFHCAAAAAAFYQAMYEKVYAQQRADGQKDEVVAFSNDFLSSQILDVQNKDGELFAKLKENVFSFAYDQSNVGVQNVFCVKPGPPYELERSDVDENWWLKYLPKTNRIFWALDGDRIVLNKKGDCNVQQIRVLYVPEINTNNPETLLPDGLVKPVIDAAVMSMMEKGQGKVVKKKNDGQENKILQNEANIPTK